MLGVDLELSEETSMSPISILYVWGKSSVLATSPISRSSESPGSDKKDIKLLLGDFESVWGLLPGGFIFTFEKFEGI